jgi:hypothetical protein
MESNNTQVKQAGKPEEAWNKLVDGILTLDEADQENLSGKLLEWASEWVAEKVRDGKFHQAVELLPLLQTSTAAQTAAEEAIKASLRTYWEKALSERVYTPEDFSVQLAEMDPDQAKLADTLLPESTPELQDLQSDNCQQQVEILAAHRPADWKQGLHRHYVNEFQETAETADKLLKKWPRRLSYFLTGKGYGSVEDVYRKLQSLGNVPEDVESKWREIKTRQKQNQLVSQWIRRGLGIVVLVVLALVAWIITRPVPSGSIDPIADQTINQGTTMAITVTGSLTNINEAILILYRENEPSSSKVDTYTKPDFNSSTRRWTAQCILAGAQEQGTTTWTAVLLLVARVPATPTVGDVQNAKELNYYRFSVKTVKPVQSASATLSVGEPRLREAGTEVVCPLTVTVQGTEAAFQLLGIPDSGVVSANGQRKPGDAVTKAVNLGTLPLGTNSFNLVVARNQVTPTVGPWTLELRSAASTQDRKEIPQIDGQPKVTFTDTDKTGEFKLLANVSGTYLFACIPDQGDKKPAGKVRLEPGKEAPIACPGVGEKPGQWHVEVVAANSQGIPCSEPLGRHGFTVPVEALQFEAGEPFGVNLTSDGTKVAVGRLYTATLSLAETYNVVISFTNELSATGLSLAKVFSGTREITSTDKVISDTIAVQLVCSSSNPCNLTLVVWVEVETLHKITENRTPVVFSIAFADDKHKYRKSFPTRMDETPPREVIKRGYVFP